MNCANVEIQGLTLENPPSWTLHYIYCEDVTIHDLTIRTHGIHNGDGIDPDSSRNSYIFNCSFATGDDCIAIKSGKNPEGNTINRPTENVRIMDCEFIEGHGISIGSEISGGVRGVLVENCVAGNLLHGFQIKATRDRGSVVEDITVRNCTLRKISILTELNYNNDGAPASTPPLFRNFKFENIDLTGANPGEAIIVNGYAEPDHRTNNVRFDGIRLRHDAIIKVDQAKDIAFTKMVSVDGGQPIFQITRSETVAH
jgi:polygalacturonase